MQYRRSTVSERARSRRQDWMICTTHLPACATATHGESALGSARRLSQHSRRVFAFEVTARSATNSATSPGRDPGRVPTVEISRPRRPGPRSSGGQVLRDGHAGGGGPQCLVPGLCSAAGTRPHGVDGDLLHIRLQAHLDIVGEADGRGAVGGRRAHRCHADSWRCHAVLAVAVACQRDGIDNRLPAGAVVRDVSTVRFAPGRLPRRGLGGFGPGPCAGRWRR
jgi:hypothetical protein